MLEHSSIKLERNGLAFTWDEDKERINIQKHDLPFAIATAAFFDTRAIFSFNRLDEVTGEERLEVIGMSLPGLIFVVYVERITINGKEINRIISAREATQKEAKRYVDGV